MTEPSLLSARPGLGQWLLLLILAAWLAVAPLVVVASLSALTGSPPDLLVQLELVGPGNPALPDWAFGLVSTLLTLGVLLLAFGPVYLGTRRPEHNFLHTSATLLIAIALFQALSALASLPWLGRDSISPAAYPTATSLLRLALTLPFLFLGLGWVEAHRHERSLIKAWHRVGLRLWHEPSAMWLALGSGALIVWPWVLVGSLGSVGTTAATLIQALPNALAGEILFRGIVFAWLWRALALPPQSTTAEAPLVGARFRAAAASLLLFVAAQGGTVLPGSDWGALLRFGAALFLGILVTELTVRSGGSVWPAVVVHFLYDWFHLAFVDPRSQEEIWHFVVQTWAPLAAVGLGLLLWAGRKLAGRLDSPPKVREKRRAGVIASAGLAGLAWLIVVILYLTLGVPGFHPDGFLIVLEEQADLSPAAAIADPIERRQWVYDTLVETAEQSQASLRAELDQRSVPYRAHYLINVIEVQGHPGLRHTFARQPEVASVQFQPGMRRYPRSFQLPSLDPYGPRGVEWNVQKVGADRVWELGYTGQGVIVGDADTGVNWEHPALKEAYLGWNGGQADHDYHWYDAWDGRTEPWDDNGHGTHTTGTVVGQDGENRVGLAPGARWIACRNMRHGVGNPGGYLTCMEFLFAPFPLSGDPLRDGDPARGAHVVNNSWGCPVREGCLPDTLQFAVDNLRAAGQMMVVSAGNEGPACGTVQDVPATYDHVFTVGATTPDDRAAGFSSRGPVTVDGSRRPKPDIVAPGVDIRSSVPDGYASLPGTSMAGPHVAGAVALLWSADPTLIGDIERTEEVMVAAAESMTVDAVCPSALTDLTTVCACGNDGPDSVPNNVYGWGQLDVYAAVQRLLAEK
jgi:subtilisin family serine protease